MTSVDRYYTVEQVVALFGKGSDWWLREGCRRRKFPHLRVGRSLRFTEEHVREITTLLEQRPASAPIPANEQEPPAAPEPESTGLALRLTPRSAARHRNLP